MNELPPSIRLTTEWPIDLIHPKWIIDKQQCDSRYVPKRHKIAPYTTSVPEG